MGKAVNNITAQLAAVRAEQRRKFEESKATGSTSANDATMPQQVNKPSRSPDKEILRRARRDSSSDVEIVGERSASKRRRLADGNLSSMPPPPLPPTLLSPPFADTVISSTVPSTTNPPYVRPRIFLTRTEGRCAGPLLANTITLGQIIDKRSISRVQGAGVSFVYSYFIGQDELFNYLPLNTKEEYPFYIGRDISQDPCINPLGVSLNLPRSSDGTFRGLNDDDHAELTAAAEKAYKQTYGRNFRCFYPKTTGGCAHSKFGAVVYEGFLRIFITSANLMALDTVYSDNHWFVVDLRRAATRTPSNSVTDFEQDFFDHASSLGLPRDVINSLYRRFDFSAVSDVRLVTSEPGTHSGQAADLFGGLRLRKVVNELVGEREVYVEVCTASVGGLEASWFKGMGNALSGGRFDEDGERLPDVKVVFCTKKDVDAAREASREGASQMGCHVKWDQASLELKQKFHHYLSKDQAADVDGHGRGCLFHIKSLLAFDKAADTTTSATPLYAYIGSANFSESAWGRIKRYKRSKTPTWSLTNCRNYEMGVVIPGPKLGGMLSEGSRWDDMVTYQRDRLRPYAADEKPYNSAFWVTGKQ